MFAWGNNYNVSLGVNGKITGFGFSILVRVPLHYPMVELVELLGQFPVYVQLN